MYKYITTFAVAFSIALGANAQHIAPDTTRAISLQQRNDYFLDAGISGSEIVPFIGKFEKLLAIYARVKFNESEATSESRRLVGLTKQFFDNWDYEIDRSMFRNVMMHYWEALSDPFVPAEMKEYITKYGGDVEELSQEAFRNSIFTNQ